MRDEEAISHAPSYCCLGDVSGCNTGSVVLLSECQTRRRKKLSARSLLEHFLSQLQQPEAED